MTPHRETLLSFVSSKNSLVSDLDPRRAFIADTAPFKGSRLAQCVTSELVDAQEGSIPSQRQEQRSNTLIVSLLKWLSFIFVPKIGEGPGRVCPVSPILPGFFPHQIDFGHPERSLDGRVVDHRRRILVPREAGPGEEGRGHKDGDPKSAHPQLFSRPVTGLLLSKISLLFQANFKRQI